VINARDQVVSGLEQAGGGTDGHRGRGRQPFRSGGTKLRTSGVALPLPQKQQVNPPIPLFKIPPAQWPVVLQRVALGESLRQIERRYHTSCEEVRRVLHAARKEALAGYNQPASLHAETRADGEQLHPGGTSEEGPPVDRSPG
jgi:hypothetical protein